MKKEKNNSNSIDIRGVSCPYTFIKSKLMLEKLNQGDTLDIILNNETALNNLPKAFQYQGQEIIEVTRLNDSDWLIRVRKRK